MGRKAELFECTRPSSFALFTFFFFFPLFFIYFLLLSPFLYSLSSSSFFSLFTFLFFFPFSYSLSFFLLPFFLSVVPFRFFSFSFGKVVWRFSCLFLLFPPSSSAPLRLPFPSLASLSPDLRWPVAAPCEGSRPCTVVISRLALTRLKAASTPPPPAGSCAFCPAFQTTTLAAFVIVNRIRQVKKLTPLYIK
eukprot:GHVT01050809.1.p1 GENE.GHVT01050809.1~~GHVT01050809.1.p1  ORF type:complete len:192 (-),score=28.43 GHVT01050809.1:698-1273(-)